VLAFGVGNVKNHVAVRDADDHVTLLIIRLAVIETLDGMRLLEYGLRQFETYAVGPLVGFGFGFVPFKFQLHDTTGYQ
jgi:hypothetical protein